MESAVQIALQEKEKRLKAKQVEEEWSKARAQALEKKRSKLRQEVIKTLVDFGKLPNVKVVGWTLNINGFVFTFKVEYVREKIRYDDDFPAEEYEGYVIRWYDTHGRCYGGCSNVESFNKEFGAHMAQYI
jgi:hypothetical protein